MIRFHQQEQAPPRWIGVDLNTTGHAVVAADTLSGRVLKLGTRIEYMRSHATKNCTKFYHEGKLWKIQKTRTRERKEFRAALNRIARQIVSFADSVCAGIKFEKLFPHRCLHTRVADDFSSFSFENGSFIALLRLVERRAERHGIPVRYVNPANTSKRCSCCGGSGKRVRKRFECLTCGKILHADVNAAFNIAAASGEQDRAEVHRIRRLRKKMRREARAELVRSAAPQPEVMEPGTVRSILMGWEPETVRGIGA